MSKDKSVTTPSLSKNTVIPSVLAGASSDILEALFQASSDAVLIVTPSWQILTANPSACDFFDYSLNELQLKSTDLVIDHSDPRVELWMTTLSKVGTVTGSLRMRKSNGEFFESEALGTIISPQNSLSFNLIMIHDISKSQSADQMIKESEIRRNFSLDAANIGDWDLDLRTNVAKRSLRHDQCFGYQESVAEWGYDTFLSHVHEDDRVFVDSNFKTAISGKGDYDVEFRVIWPDQSLHWLWSKGKFYFDEMGKPIRVSGIQVEITQRRNFEETLRINTRALESASNGIVISDTLAPDMPITYVNKAFERITGYTSSEVVGRNCRFLNKGNQNQESLKVLKTALSEGREIQVELENFRKDGTSFINELRVSPVFGDDGKLTHFVGIQTDITERKQTEIETLRLNRSLKMLSLCNQMLIRTNDENQLNIQMCRVAVEIGGYKMAWVGYAEDDEYKSIVPQAHFGDFRHLENVMPSWAEDSILGRGPIGKTVRTGNPIVLEDFSNNKDFSPWFSLATKLGYCGIIVLPLKNKDRTFGVIGLYVGEITHLAHEELNLLIEMANNLSFGIMTIRNELERLEANINLYEKASLLDKAHDAILVRSIDHRILYWNKGAERIYGWKSDEVLGQYIDKLLHKDPKRFYDFTRKTIEDDEWTGEIEQFKKDGTHIFVESNWTLVKDNQGQPKSILSINTDITARKAADSKIQQLAFYDGLTGLPNRQLLNDRLNQSLSLSYRNKNIGGLLFIDLDNFKALNDTLGHDVGDLLLQEVAKRLSTSVRDTDTVARFGGDEFVVILDNLSSDKIEAVALIKIIMDKILLTFSHVFQLANHHHYSTPSIGVALYGDEPTNVEDLLKRADVAMYEAKAAGKNTTRFFNPEMLSMVSTRVELEESLRLALSMNELYLL